MIRGTITYWDGTITAIAIGAGEDVAAPRHLKALENAGWPIDDNITTMFKAWLAAKRQGDVPGDSKFETWSDTVAELDLRPSDKQIEQAVILGKMSREEADRLKQAFADDLGEAEALPG